MDRKKLLIVAFYLAKFNEVALRNLGYKGFREAFNEIGNILNYSPNSVKNRRDDFDPLFEHRAGWHQFELNKNSLEIVNSFDHLSEEGLRAIVLDILNNKVEEDLTSIVSINKNNINFITRGVTGKKAEQFYIDWFTTNYAQETLIDTRDMGCGYDFEVDGSEDVFEVKGLSGDEGGIQFTDKEWSVASIKKEHYHLIVVRNCFSDTPEVEIYHNPSEIFTPKKQISTVINVNWGVSARDLRNGN